MSDDLNLIRILSHWLPAPTDTTRIVVLTGARQTGKTPLVKRLYPALNYTNLDAPENRDIMRSLSTFDWSKTIGNAVIDTE